MTAEPYAAATGLTQRLAAAYSSAVPTGPRDHGFFGSASVTWRVSADLSAPVAGLRSLLIQALHPLVMVGVDQYALLGELSATKDWRRGEPLRHLERWWILDEQAFALVLSDPPVRAESSCHKDTIA